MAENWGKNSATPRVKNKRIYPCTLTLVLRSMCDHFIKAKEITNSESVGFSDVKFDDNKKIKFNFNHPKGKKIYNYGIEDNQWFMAVENRIPLYNVLAEWYNLCKERSIQDVRALAPKKFWSNIEEKKDHYMINLRGTIRESVINIHIVVLFRSNSQDFEITMRELNNKGYSIKN